MDYRSNVYSPLQNIAVWLGAWLVGAVSADECSEALDELGGSHRLDGAHPEEEFGTLSVLRHVRLLAQPYLESIRVPAREPTHEEAVLELLLSGPGDPPRLPAETEAARALSDAALGGILVRTPDPLLAHVLVPKLDLSGMAWKTFTVAGPLPASEYISPGEADYLLADATRQAARLVASMPPISGQDIPDPRLTVGTLSDFYEAPGLPYCTPPRAARLFARADRVAAILETVATKVGDHSLDPALFPLWRHLRIARTTGVSYAIRELRT